jgi:hypothetical protein
MVVPNICQSSIKNLLHFTLLAPKICGGFQIFEKFLQPCPIWCHLHEDGNTASFQNIIFLISIPLKIKAVNNVQEKDFSSMDVW